MPQVDWEILRDFFTNNHTIEAVWVFGSSQDGIVPEGRDLDIGILFSKKPTLDDMVDLRSSLQAAMNIEEIDIISLNEASPILRFEAIKGRKIYFKDKESMAGIVSLWAREYEDEMAMLEKSVHL